MQKARTRAKFGHNGLSARRLFLTNDPESAQALKLLKESGVTAKVSTAEKVAPTISLPTLFAPEGVFSGLAEIQNYIQVLVRERAQSS